MARTQAWSSGARRSVVPLRSNTMVNTDAQGRLLGHSAPSAPIHGRGLPLR